MFIVIKESVCGKWHPFSVCEKFSADVLPVTSFVDWNWFSILFVPLLGCNISDQDTPFEKGTAVRCFNVF